VTPALRRLLRGFGGARIPLWAVPLALLLANLVWLAVFGSGSRLRAAELDRRHERLERETAALRGRLEARERLWVEATENEERIERLLGERLSTERARFTELVREVKGLAERAGLAPQSIGYPAERLEEYGLARRSFVLPVEGSYASLRTFLNLVELSSSFLTVEEISVSEARGELSVRLRLSTFFRAADEGRVAARPVAPEGPGT
jgi:hypothetical protein